MLTSAQVSAGLELLTRCERERAPLSWNGVAEDPRLPGWQDPLVTLLRDLGGLRAQLENSRV
jgi:hypothetical protein